ncbi:MAG: hypothetical protein ACMXYF_03490, partial [Candidatus Woesearchaeota archaeon]
VKKTYYVEILDFTKIILKLAFIQSSLINVTIQNAVRPLDDQGSSNHYLIIDSNFSPNSTLSSSANNVTVTNSSSVILVDIEPELDISLQTFNRGANASFINLTALTTVYSYPKDVTFAILSQTQSSILNCSVVADGLSRQPSNETSGVSNVTLEVSDIHLQSITVMQTRVVENISACTIINDPGYYVLVNDLQAGAFAPCIQINASNVTLDGNGFEFTGENSVSIVSQNQSDITLKNIKSHSVGNTVALEDVTGFSMYDFTLINGSTYGVSLSNTQHTHFENGFIDMTPGGIVSLNAQYITLINVTIQNAVRPLDDQGGSNHYLILDSNFSPNSTLSSSANNLTVINSSAVILVDLEPEVFLPTLVFTPGNNTIELNLSDYVVVYSYPKNKSFSIDGAGNTSVANCTVAGDKLTCVSSGQEGNMTLDLVVSDIHKTKVANTTVQNNQSQTTTTTTTGGSTGPGNIGEVFLVENNETQTQEEEQTEQQGGQATQEPEIPFGPGDEVVNDEVTDADDLLTGQVTGPQGGPFSTGRVFFYILLLIAITGGGYLYFSRKN